MIVPALILAGVMAVVLWRPRGLGVGWPALAGAVACVALRLVDTSDLAQVLGRTWNATVALVGLMLLSATLDRNGAFRAAAHRLARLAQGNGRGLFVGLCLLTAAASSLLANDGAILLMTPIVAELGILLELDPKATLAYLFSMGFLCDAVSTLLPTSNLTNILLVDTLHIHEARFFVTLVGPTLVAFVVGTGVLFVQLRRALPLRFATAALEHEPAFSRRSLRGTAAALTALMGGYALAAWLRWPLGVVVLVVAVGLLAYEAHGGALQRRRVLAGLPWSIVVFATGLFVIVTALAKAGASTQLAVLLDPAGRDPLSALLFAGGLVALLAALGNNLPTLVVSLLALEHVPLRDGLPFAALLGANIGSKLIPTGSLATLLWLEMLRQRKIQISWDRYVTWAFFPTVLTLLSALLALSLLG